MMHITRVAEKIGDGLTGPKNCATCGACADFDTLGGAEEFGGYYAGLPIR